MLLLTRSCSIPQRSKTLLLHLSELILKPILKLILKLVLKLESNLEDWFQGYWARPSDQYQAASPLENPAGR